MERSMAFACARRTACARRLVWMEDPGYYAARTTFLAAGLKVVPVPIDEHGMNVPRGAHRATGARPAYVTPSH
jgi:GntR family transcriptional regulator/MocR family aminotransferase